MMNVPARESSNVKIATWFPRIPSYPSLHNDDWTSRNGNFTDDDWDDDDDYDDDWDDDDDWD